MWLYLQGHVEVTDDISDEQELSVEVVKRAGNAEQLDEITVRHDETIRHDRRTLTVRVVPSQQFYTTSRKITTYTIRVKS